MFSGLARSICQISTRGIENLPSVDSASGPGLIVLNHTTPVDVVVTMAALYRAGLRVDLRCDGGCEPGHRHVRVLATDDLLKFPVTRQLAEVSGVIPVTLGHGSSALLAARRALDEGELVVIYPEGDVSAGPDGSPRRWRPGAVALAAGRRVPVYPVAHHDSRRLGNGSIALSIGQALTGVVRRPVIRVYAGSAVTPDELAGRDRREAQRVLEDSLWSAWRVAATGRIPSSGSPSRRE